MDIYASDYEKGENIKGWWRKNGRSVILGVVLGIAVILSVRYWINDKQVQAESAANMHQKITNLVAEGEWSNAKYINKLLLSQFPSTPYAVFSAFKMAQSTSNDNIEVAKSYLRWVVANASLTGHVEIALLRLAKLFLSENNHEISLSLIDESSSDSFSSLFLELRGDVLSEQGKLIESLEAYRSAKLNLIEDDQRLMLLNMKMDDMAVADDS